MRRNAYAARVLVFVVATVVAPAQGGLVGEGERALEATDEGPAVVHPAVPLFRTDAAGWPVQGDSGFVALRNEGPGFVYGQWFLEQRRGRPTVESGRENWGQVETFSVLARVVREMHRRHPEGPPLRIWHISGEYGGFPDFQDRGYSAHHSHQTGQQVNVLLPPRDAKAGFVDASRDDEALWDRRRLIELVDVAFGEGARIAVTNRALMDWRLGHEPAFPSLRAFPAEFTVETPYSQSHFRKDGAQLLLLKPPGDHANHVNLSFSPRE